MTYPDVVSREKHARAIGPALLPVVLVCGFVLPMLVLFHGDATSAEKSDYANLQVASPDAREITIADTARLNDVLQVLRTNNVTFEGPVPIVVNESGEPRTMGYDVTVRLDTYNPRGETDPGCPYRQVTKLSYDLQGRLYVYYVSYQPLCIK